MSTKRKIALASSSASDEERKEWTSGGRAKIHHAVLAGIFAACGSVFGKFADGFDLLYPGPVLLKGILLVLMVTSNTVGCALFVKALNGCESSVPATVTSAATNYISSAFLGFLIFGESTTLIWWCGASLVILGLILACYTPSKEDSACTKEKLKHQ